MCDARSRIDSVCMQVEDARCVLALYKLVRKEWEVRAWMQCHQISCLCNMTPQTTRALNQHATFCVCAQSHIAQKHRVIASKKATAVRKEVKRQAAAVCAGRAW